MIFTKLITTIVMYSQQEYINKYAKQSHMDFEETVTLLLIFANNTDVHISIPQYINVFIKTLNASFKNHFPLFSHLEKI